MAVDTFEKRKRALSFWRTILPPVAPDGSIDGADRALMWGQYYVFVIEPRRSISGASHVVDSISGRSYAKDDLTGNSNATTSINGRSYMG